MPAQTEVRSGLSHTWPYGEQGWNSGMDANLLRIGRFAFHLSIKSATLNDPPASPANGDSYIVGSIPTGAWAAKQNQIAVWVSGTPSGSWVFATPRKGWTAYNEATQSGLVYDTTWQPAWSIAPSVYQPTAPYRILDRDLTAPPGSPIINDVYIVGAASTGDWATHDGKLAWHNGSSGQFKVPANGELATIIDESKIAAYISSNWTTGVAL